MDVRKVLAENLQRLMNSRPELNSLPRMEAETAKKGVAVSKSNLARALHGDTPFNLDALASVAKVFGIEAWQLLAPDAQQASPEPEGSQAQLLKLFDVLGADDQAELLDEVHRRAARALGDQLLSEKFGVKGYASGARVAQIVLPQMVSPGDRRRVNIPVAHDRRRS